MSRETPEEKARRIGVPLIPPKPTLPAQDNTLAVCGVCGIELKQTMGYVCPHSDCPCFSRTVM